MTPSAGRGPKRNAELKRAQTKSAVQRVKAKRPRIQTPKRKPKLNCKRETTCCPQHKRSKNHPPLTTRSHKTVQKLVQPEEHAGPQHSSTLHTADFAPFTPSPNAPVTDNRALRENTGLAVVPAGRGKIRAGVASASSPRGAGPPSREHFKSPPLPLPCSAALPRKNSRIPDSTGARCRFAPPSPFSPSPPDRSS